MLTGQFVNDLCETLIELVVEHPSGLAYRYTSTRVGARIGEITEVTCTGNGMAVRLPPSGFIDQVCDSYPAFGASSAMLHVPRYSLRLVDANGDGTVTDVVGLVPDRFRSILGPLTLRKAVTELYSEMGRNLGGLLGCNRGKLSAIEVGEIVSSCGSRIKLIINDRDYTKIELLHAILPPQPASGISVIQRYSMGEDIVHIFTRGKGRLLRTVGGRDRFESIAFEITDRNPWEMIVVHPDEYYQVVNDGPQDVEYFWAFINHEDAYNRGALHGLTKDLNDLMCWDFLV